MASIYKRDDGTWRAQVSVSSKRKSKSGFTSKREATAWAAEQERLAEENLSTNIPDRPFRDALERYRDTISISKPGLKLEITEKYDESTAD